MKPFVILASIFATVAAGNNGGFGGFGLGGGSGGAYSLGGQQHGGGYPGGGSGGGGLGGHSAFSPGGSFGGGLSNPAPVVGGYSGGGGGGLGGGFNNAGGGGNFQTNDGGNFGGGGGQIRKFVSVHVGPEEPQFTQTKVIRAGGPPDKHVNIIFVKAPSAASAQQTEVILPEPAQQKTLVYVLVKKQESTSNVRVRGPAPTRPSKPEVYFIRYKDGSGQIPGTPQPGGSFGGDIGLGGGGPLPNVAPGTAYGPPLSGGIPGGGYSN